MRTGTFLRPGRHECSALSTGLDAATVPTLEPRQRTMSISEAAKNGFVQTCFFFLVTLLPIHTILYVMTETVFWSQLVISGSGFRQQVCGKFLS